MKYFLQLGLAFFFTIKALSMATPEENKLCHRLHEAVRNNDLILVAYLGQIIDIDCRDELGRTALHVWALNDGSKEIFWQLVYKGGATLDTRAHDQTTAFLAAAIHQKYRAMMTLMLTARHYNPVNVNAQTMDGFGVLHIAVLVNDEDLIKTALGMRADRLLVDHAGRTAFDLAQKTGLFKLAQLIRPELR